VVHAAPTLRCLSQNPPVPLGEPTPVGPSHPGPALHHRVVGQVPLLPEVWPWSPQCAAVTKTVGEMSVPLQYAHDPSGMPGRR
jgi:hypothetical protein